MIRLNLTEEQYQRLRSLAARYPDTTGDNDINNLKAIIEEKDKRLWEHNAFTKSKTASNPGDKAIALEIYHESRNSRF